MKQHRKKLLLSRQVL